VQRSLRVGIPKGNVSRLKGLGRRFLRHENAVLVVVLAVLAGGVAGITGGKSIQPANVSNVLLQSSIRGIASIGQAFVILTSGIDLSVGGIGVSAALLGTTLMTPDMILNPIDRVLPLPVGMVVMMAVGLGWGALNGTLVSRTAVPALIVTLGMWQITQGVAFETCHGYTVFELPAGLAWFGQGNVAGVPVPVIIFMVVAVIAYLVLRYTVYGRSVYATGGNQASAWLSGINVRDIFFSVYAISGFLAGVAAIIMTGRVVSASMRTLEGLELDSIAAVVIGGVSLFGGRGSVIGVVIGALIIGVLNNAMSLMGADPATVGLAKGIIIIGAVFADYSRRK
jgi:putative xylitol transport system permease protein